LARVHLNHTSNIMRFPEVFPPLIQWSVLHMYHMSYEDNESGCIVIPNCKTYCRLDKWLGEDELMEPETAIIFVHSILRQFNLIQTTYGDRFRLLGMNTCDFYVIDDGESFIYSAPFLPSLFFYSANDIPICPMYVHPDAKRGLGMLPYIVESYWWVYAFGDLLDDCLGRGFILHGKLRCLVERCKQCIEPVVYC